MTVQPLPAAPSVGAFEPDEPVVQSRPSADGFAAALSSALDEASGALARASTAESRFIRGSGGLQEVVLERAQADVMLAIATSAASRVTQSLSTIFNLQV